MLKSNLSPLFFKLVFLIKQVIVIISKNKGFFPNEKLPRPNIWYLVLEDLVQALVLVPADR